MFRVPHDLHKPFHLQTQALDRSGYGWVQRHYIHSVRDVLHGLLPPPVRYAWCELRYRGERQWVVREHIPDC